MKGNVTGGCQCGAVRYATAGPLIAYCCHCTECRKQSTAAFGMSVPVYQDRFNLQGEIGCWTRSTDSGSKTDCYFCIKCGTRLYHSGHNRPGLITVKHGSLDIPDNVPVIAHIWTKSKARWLNLSDGLPQWDTQPGTTEQWMTLFRGENPE